MKRPGASTFALSILIGSCSGGTSETDRSEWNREQLGVDAEIVVDAAARRQHIRGFGASSAWTGGNLSAEMADLLFTPEGIGLSLLRMQIKPNGSTDETPTARLAVARGATVWAAPWSPPGSWKTNGITTNGGALLPEYYEAWADRLVTWVKNRAAEGVPLYALSPQNEPNWTAEWDTCRYTPDELRIFIRDYLAPKLRAESPSTKLMAPETIDWISLASYADPLLADPEVSAALDIVAVHAYGGTPVTYQPAIDAGKELWETEVSYDLGEGIFATLETARQIERHLVAGNVNAFHYWWLVSRAEDGEGGLTHEGELTPPAHGLAHYSKFIRPGFVRLDVAVTPRVGLTLSAYANLSNDRVVIVGVNETANPLVQRFRFQNVTAIEVEPWLTTESVPLAKQPRFPFANAFAHTLPPLSVTTLIVTNETDPPTGTGGMPGVGGAGGAGGPGGEAGEGTAGAAASGGESPIGSAGAAADGGAPSEPLGGRGGSTAQPSDGGEDSRADGGEPTEPDPSEGGIGGTAATAGTAGTAGSSNEAGASARRPPAPYSACLCATPGKPASGGVNALALIPLFAWVIRKRRATTKLAA